MAMAVLFGVAAGLAVAALASARRTDSAYDRLLVATKASDISIDYGTYDPEIAARIAGLPGVVSSSSYVAFNSGPVDETGSPLDGYSFETVASIDGRFFDQDRVVVVRGRLPDPTRADEVAVNEATASEDGLRMGDQITLGVVSDEELYSVEDPSTLVLSTVQHVTVVGEVLFTDEVIQDDNDVITRLLTTPAFTERYASLGTYAWQGLRLAPGTDLAAVSTAVESIVVDAQGDQAFFLARAAAEDRSRVDRSVLPQVTTLLIIAALIALVALVLVHQAAARQLRSVERALEAYRSFGLARRGLLLTAALPSLLALVAGAGLAMVVATALSPLSPYGALHRAEPEPGIDLDVLAVVGGAAVLAVISACAIMVSTAVAVRRLHGHQRSAAPTRQSRLAAWPQTTGAPVPVAVGAGYALQPQSGPQGGPVRVVAAGAAVAVAALTAAVCFGASLNRLVGQPRLYGWNWDAAVIDQAGYGAINLERAAQAFDSDPDVESWAPLNTSSTTIDDVIVPVIGVRPGDLVGPRILSGRSVATTAEIVLGRSTMRLLGKHDGDTVRFGPTGIELRIVGTATLPAIGQAHSSHPSPGEGAIVLNSTLSLDPALAGSSADGSDEPPMAPPTVVAIRYRPGADPAVVGARLSASTAGIGDFPGSSEFLDLARPAEIVNARSIVRLPTLTAVLLTGAALVSLSLALVAGVRRRRSDLAVLRAIGFTRRQTGVAILTQSLIVAVLGIAVGAPLGLVAGRWSWGRFATRMAVDPSPSVPIATIGVVLAGLAVAAVLVAVAPSQIAARIRAGDVLRRD